jgi:hypothetical protein
MNIVKSSTSSAWRAKARNCFRSGSNRRDVLFVQDGQGAPESASDDVSRIRSRIGRVSSTVPSYIILDPEHVLFRDVPGYAQFASYFLVETIEFVQIDYFLP